MRSFTWLLLTLIIGVSSVFGQKSESIAAAGVFAGQEYSNSKLELLDVVRAGGRFTDSTKNEISVQQNKRIAASSGDQGQAASADATVDPFSGDPAGLWRAEPSGDLVGRSRASR